ncbi:UNKNOWN [Stylonychia lemnae]|uniref:Uncharacterized protein n=1 Tax=Stylonychia lemnae TaxID=5949 RepID=A0A078AJC7_STYLE|nr:UNKNOWN [Stylonychia lemnae]|eukprot:CDW82435.1 UNKNOWN [Stylonychia lemnae]
MKQTLIITEIDKEKSLVQSQKQIKVNEGKVIFDSLTFISKPGSVGVMFKIYSPNIIDSYINVYLVSMDTIRQIKIKKNAKNVQIMLNVPEELEQLQMLDSGDHQIPPQTQWNAYRTKLAQEENLLNKMRIVFAYLVMVAQSKDRSTVLKILTNFVQMLTMTFSLKLDWPVSMQDFHNVVAQIGYSQDSIISIDCFLSESAPYNTSHSHIYLKTILIGLMPFMIFVIFLVVMILLIIFQRKRFEIIKKWLVVQALIVVHFLHPSISKYIVGIFSCTEINQGQYWLLSDVQVECWNDEHLKFCLTIGIPFFLLWVLGYPSFIFIHLFRNRKNINDPDFQAKYQFIFQMMIQPYQVPILNELERREIQTTIFIYFSALLFTQKLSSNIKPFTFVNQGHEIQVDYCSQQSNKNTFENNDISILPEEFKDVYYQNRVALKDQTQNLSEINVLRSINELHQQHVANQKMWLGKQPIRKILFIIVSVEVIIEKIQ